MAKKNGKGAGKSAVTTGSPAKTSQHSRGLTPNDRAELQTPADRDASVVTCAFLGKTYYLGDKVCWHSALWVCTANGWGKTDQPC